MFKKKPDAELYVYCNYNYLKTLKTDAHGFLKVFISQPYSLQGLVYEKVTFQFNGKTGR